ncbi:MAG TPA: hypothetical protein VMV87_05935, partial [Burkholderiales bacterium]|nr:hypothetical protein [Burkholderiales bacterium]
MDKTKAKSLTKIREVAARNPNHLVELLKLQPMRNSKFDAPVVGKRISRLTLIAYVGYNPPSVASSCVVRADTDAGWSSLAARRAHNPKVV